MIAGRLKVVGGRTGEPPCNGPGASEDGMPGDGAVVSTVHTERTVYVNHCMAALAEKLSGERGRMPEFIEKLSRALKLYRSVVRRAPYVCQYETVVRGRNGEEVRVEITASEILWQEEEAFLIFVRVLSGGAAVSN